MTAAGPLSLNTITVKTLSLPQVIEACARHGIPAIAPWRDVVQAAGLPQAAKHIREAGLKVTGLCRGGMFPAADAAGRAAAEATGHKPKKAEAASISNPASIATEAVWIMPQGAGPALKMKMWLDYQNDVKVSDVQLAAREGYTSVEHTKRYTTLGMATDQGKVSNINGLAVLSGALNQPIPTTGTTTFRPPYTPLTLGTIAAEARGDLFQPLRKTPMHDWHQARGAHWEPVGHWRRAYCYPKSGESHADAVAREIGAVRAGVGTLDASTLGKIIVKGPDAGRFLDMIYTGMMSSLPVGKCRYGLMCNEQGFLSDDGVVARID